MTPAVETPCTQHEEQIQENSREIAELKARANYKDKRINELIEDNKRIEKKIDNLTDTVNKVMLNSIKDDKDLGNRVTSLETKIETQEKIIKEYDEKARKDRKEDRDKTNQYIAIMGVIIAVLSFIFANILK